MDELELSVRSYNCLKNADIRTIRDLVQRSEREMLATKNFGKKSLNEIKDILNGMGLDFGMEFDEQGNRFRVLAAAILLMLPTLRRKKNNKARPQMVIG